MTAPTDPAQSLAAALLRQRAQAEGRPVPTDDEVRAELAETLQSRPLHPAVALAVRVAENEARIREANEAARRADIADIADAVADRLRQEAPAPAPARQRPQEAKASRYAAFGSDGGKASAGPRRAAVAAAEDQVAALALKRLRRGMPSEETVRRWSLDRMAYWLREEWPKPEPMPAIRTLTRYLGGAIRRELLPPVVEWPLEASTAPSAQSEP